MDCCGLERSSSLFERMLHLLWAFRSPFASFGGPNELGPLSDHALTVCSGPAPGRFRSLPWALPTLTSIPDHNKPFQSSLEAC